MDLIDNPNIPQALKAQVSSLLQEMQRRNRELLIQHVRFVEEYAAVFHEIAKHAPDNVVLELDEMHDLVKCGAVTFACDDLIYGAKKFIDIMEFASSWKEKLALINLSTEMAKRAKTEQ